MGARAVVGALRGGVAVEELLGAAFVAIVEFEGPIPLAGAEDADVMGPAYGVGHSHETFLEDGVGVAAGEGLGIGNSFEVPLLGHGLKGRVIAPTVCVFRPRGGRCWCKGRRGHPTRKGTTGWSSVWEILAETAGKKGEIIVSRWGPPLFDLASTTQQQRKGAADWLPAGTNGPGRECR